MMRRMCVVAAAAFATACGGNDGAEVDVVELGPGDECPSGGIEIESGGDVFTVCNGSDGENGADGLPGSDGDPGKDGADGKDGAAGFEVIKTTNCIGSPTLPSGYVAALQYSIHEFANGYVFVECSSQSSLTGDTASYLFTSEQAGATNHKCIALADSNATVDGGFWSYEFTGTAHRATFNDPSDVDDQSFWDFPESDCDVF